MRQLSTCSGSRTVDLWPALRMTSNFCTGKLSCHTDMCGHLVPCDAWAPAFAPCSMSVAVPCTRVRVCLFVVHEHVGVRPAGLCPCVLVCVCAHRSVMLSPGPSAHRGSGCHEPGGFKL